jgi:hypothetical protein
MLKYQDAGKAPRAMALLTAVGRTLTVLAIFFRPIKSAIWVTFIMLAISTFCGLSQVHILWFA